MTAPVIGAGDLEVVAWEHPTAGWARTKYHSVLVHCHKSGPGPVPLVRQSEAAARILELEAERDEARQIVRDIYWMALRYADGRKSYAVGMCNDAVRKGYDAGWLKQKATGGDTITPEFARDGMDARSSLNQDGGKP